MQKIIVLFGALAVIAIAIVGSLYIFELRTGDEALMLLAKSVGGIVLLGGCTVAISLLVSGASKNSQDEK